MEGIIVLDFGGQYAHLIANRVRRLKAFSEIKTPGVKLDELGGACGIILSGGPGSVYEEGGKGLDKRIFRLGIPILGICYGHQLIGHLLGGKVKGGKTREYGFAKLSVKNKKGLFDGLGNEEKVWMSHGDAIVELPAGFESIGSTPDDKNAAIANFERKIFGMQFHAEVTHTPSGMRMLENFVKGVCNCKENWTMENFIEEKAKEIRKQVGGKNVFMLASGGVDSTVALALLYRALGSERVYGLHVDNGFMRKGESEFVGKSLAGLGFKNFHVIDASEKFYNAVKGVVDPEKKRKIIGELFLTVANEELRKLGLMEDEWLLGQGTIYPDTIETGRTEHSAVIKTHHNRIDSIKELVEGGLVVEPIDQLYKDEVRELGRELGLPKELVERHPFPGPGLAIRALCSDGKIPGRAKETEKLAKEIAKKYNFGLFILPVKAVGVQGDERTYSLAAALKGEADWETLEKCSTEITNKVKQINRVVWILEPKETSGKIELLKKSLNKERMDLLREADHIANEVMDKHKQTEKIWQCPIVLLPISINGQGESIAIRPVESMEAMTASFAKMPMETVKEIAEKVMAIEGIGAVFYDITHKPPATICWE